MKKRVCIVCGIEFLALHNHELSCSPECRKKRLRQLMAKHNAMRKGTKRKSYSDPIKATAPVALEVLQTARRKPKGVSDVRWRIELRRRANSAYYNLFGGRC